MRQRKDHLDVLAVTLLVACSAFWGFQQVLIKATVVEVPALWQSTLRFAGATVVLGLWCRVRGVPLFERDGTLGPGLLSGVLFAAEFACIYLGLRDTTASRLTVFVYTAPFVVALLLPYFVPAERLRGMQWAGLLLAFGGVALAFSEGFLGRQVLPNQLRGDVLALGGGLFWGLTTLLIRSSRLSTASAEKMLFYQVAGAAAVTPLLSLAFGEHWSLTYSARAWGSIALQTIVGAFASYLAWMWLLRHYPATRMSSFTFLAPVFALVFGVTLLDEPFTLQLLLALAGVALGIVLVNRRPAPR
jgi:drug/metabolite transporter (DMT)-like permease